MFAWLSIVIPPILVNPVKVATPVTPLISPWLTFVKPPTTTPATIVDSRTLVPVRAIAESFGSTVGWDGETKTVTIKG